MLLRERNQSDTYASSKQPDGTTDTTSQASDKIREPRSAKTVQQVNRLSLGAHFMKFALV